jgi:hypothetical protein
MIAWMRRHIEQYKFLTEARGQHYDRLYIDQNGKLCRELLFVEEEGWNDDQYPYDIDDDEEWDYSDDMEDGTP